MWCCGRGKLCLTRVVPRTVLDSAVSGGTSGSVAPDPGSAALLYVAWTRRLPMTFTVLGQSSSTNSQPENMSPRRRSSAEGDAHFVTVDGRADSVTWSRLRHPAGPDGHLLVRVFAENEGSVVVAPARTRLTDWATVRALAGARNFSATHGWQLTLRSPIEGRGAGPGVAQSGRSGSRPMRPLGHDLLRSDGVRVLGGTRPRLRPFSSRLLW